MDTVAQVIYLFGGWDGEKDLCDLWSYNIVSCKWSLVSRDTGADGGPGPRSCHKMVLDSQYKQIFVLGRYLDR